MRRRDFLTTSAALPLPFAVPWLQQKAERQPQFPPMKEEPLRCACGDLPLQPEIEDIIIRFKDGPVEWARHRAEECFMQQRQGRISYPALDEAIQICEDSPPDHFFRRKLPDLVRMRSRLMDWEIDHG